MKKVNRTLAVLLILILALTALPPSAFAASDLNVTTIVVPHGATIQLNKKPVDSASQPIHYVTFDQIEPVLVSMGDEYDTYTYNLESIDRGRCHYRVSETGCLTAAGWLNQSDAGKTIKVDREALPGERIDYAKDTNPDNDYYDDGLLMNIGPSSFLDLKQGDTFKIKPYRAWQIVNSVSANYFIEPDWHFEVVQGDAVTVDKTGLVTADSEGMSIVRVTYDSIKVGGQYYNGIDPIHTGIVVINVGGAPDSSFKTGIDLTEFDTIYYTDKINGISQGNSYAEYTFTPDSGSAVSVLEAPAASAAVSGSWTTEWKDYSADSDGSYTIKLGPGRNIVKIEKDGMVKYHVIRAAGLGINIANKTYPGEALMQGSVARITFDGLYMPLPKLAAVYNPGYSFEGEGKVKVQYQLNGATLRGKGTQYTLRTTNQIDIPLDEIGTYTLTGGTVYLTYFGGGGNHYEIPDSGRSPNFGAGEFGPFWYSRLPDITLEAGDGEAVAEQAKMLYSGLKEIKAGVSNLSIFTADQVRGSVSEPVSEEKITQNNIVYRANSASTGYLALVFSPLKSDVTMLWRYWQGEDRSAAKVKKLEEAPFVFTADGMPLLISLKKSDMVNAELIVAPKNESAGYPKTYSFKAFGAWENKVTNKANYEKSQILTKNLPYLYDVTLTPLAGEEDFRATDGLFRAKNVTYTDDGQERTLDFGYGFLITEAEHSVDVPHSTDSVRLNLELARLLNTSLIEGISAKISVDGHDLETLSGAAAVNNIVSTSAISLDAGTTQIKIEVTRVRENAEDDLSMTYVIDVIRRGPPKSVVFTELDGAASLIVKNSKNQTMKAEAGDSRKYDLEPGQYTYILTRDGYISQRKSFTVGDDLEQAVTLSKLEQSPKVKESDRVTVVVRSDVKTVRNSVSLPMSDDPKVLDLVTEKRYVDYNAGAYTALHAVMDALGAGLDPLDFECYKGYLKPAVELDDTGHGPDSGWICEVNKKYVAEPAYYPLRPGDSVVYYYSKGYAGMIHPWFDREMVSIRQGDSVTLTLSGIKVKNDSAEPEPLSGASVLVNNAAKGVTGESGQITLKFDEAGTYAVTAQKKDLGGNNLLTFNYCLVNVSSSDLEKIPGKTKVSFRLIGATKYDGGNNKYVNWIATRSHTFDGDSIPVYDVFTEALAQAGLAYVGAESNYVSKIKAPTAYGGYWLSEFDNGGNSGWMYTVNGVHPQFGLKEYLVTTGDKIVWHYINDYKKEEDLYTWLEADDTDPPKDGSVIDMSKDASSTTITIEATARTDSTGKAAALISARDISSALAQALGAIKAAEADGKKNVTAEIKLDIKTDGKATYTETTVPASSVKEVAEVDNIALTVETPVGSVSFDQKSLAAIAAGTTGSEIKIGVGRVDKGKLSADQQKAVADRPVFELTLTSGKQIMTDFRDGKVTVSLPYKLASGEKAENVCIYYLDGSGKLSKVEGAKYDEKAGLVTFITDHFSYYVIGYQAPWKNPFDDVKSEAWYYSAVEYAVKNGLFNGTTATTFSPNSQMTRAMLVTVLYRMNQATKPTATSGSAATTSGSAVTTGGAVTAVKPEANNFIDVKPGQWYTDAISWANANGITSGIGNNLFGTNSDVTREQMAAILYNYAKYRGYDTSKAAELKAFTDASTVSAWAQPAIKWTSAEGLVTGRTAVTLVPKGNASRAEVATILKRFAEDVAK